MAVIDGLDEIVSSTTVNIKELPEYRRLNLINELFKKVGSFSEENKVKNFLKVGISTGFSELEIKKGVLLLENGQISYNPKPTLERNIKRRTI